MFIIALIMFWLCIFLIFESYVLFPAILRIIVRGKKDNEIIHSQSEDELPFVSIVFSAYNEEKVIEKKLLSTLSTFYSKNKFEILIGSDCSTDKTNMIIETFAKQYPQVRFFPFSQRNGKILIINELIQHTKGEIIIMTDANVFFNENTIYQLVKHFKNLQIGIVGGNFINKNEDKTGINIQENLYIEREIRIKYNEGKIWGTMMGAFGGCYSIRKKSLVPIPQNFIVDDFYITMNVLKQNQKAIIEPQAFCYEDITPDIHIEFNRKVRISTGNFQNMKYFYNLLFSIWKPVTFCYLSHKVFRWCTPFFLIIVFISGLILSIQSFFYLFLTTLYISSFLLPLLDNILKEFSINNKILRFTTHFYGMNIALFYGFIKFLKGVNTNVWKPTIRG